MIEFFLNIVEDILYFFARVIVFAICLTVPAVLGYYVSIWFILLYILAIPAYISFLALTHIMREEIEE